MMRKTFPHLLSILSLLPLLFKLVLKGQGVSHFYNLFLHVDIIIELKTDTRTENVFVLLRTLFSSALRISTSGPTF